MQILKFATENVAQEIIDAGLLEEQPTRKHLNELRNLINLYFGLTSIIIQEILTERKRRIDDSSLRKEREKQLLKEIEKGKEIQDLFTYATIGIGVIFTICLIGYAVFIVL